MRPTRFLTAVLLLAIAALPAAAQVSISQLPYGGLMQPTDTVPMVRNGTTMKAAPFGMPANGSVMISNGTASPSGIPEIDGDCLLGVNGAWTTGSCGNENPGTVTVFSAGNLSPLFTTTTTNDSTTPALSFSAVTQSPNLVYAGPGSGSAAAPSFRSIVGADLPDPSATTLGGIESITSAAHNWIAYIDTSGVPHQSQPAFTDISGTASNAQIPAPTTSSLGGVEAASGATSNEFLTYIDTLGLQHVAQPSFSNLSGNATLAQLPSIGSNTLLGNNTGSSSTPTALSVDSVNALIGRLSDVPQGRLSLSSTAPVLTGDVTAATTIYYLPYAGSMVPIYDGTQFSYLNIGSGGISLTLNTTNMPTTEVFDVYATNQSGTPTLCAMYWGSNTSRSTSVGGKSGSANASVAQLDGLWVNNASIASGNCYNGTTSYAISANQGTLLGSFYTTANGQTQFNLKPAAASGGTANIVGFANIYNTKRITTLARDSSSSYTYATPTWRTMDGSNSNRVTWVDPLGQELIDSRLRISASSAIAGSVIQIGVNEDATTGSPNDVGYQTSAVSTLAESWQGMSSEENFAPALGLHFAQAMEISTSGNTITFNVGGQAMALAVDLDY